MVLFSDRLKIAKLYKKWTEKEHVKDCPESVIVFLQIKGWLNEEKCKSDLKKLCEAKEDEK